MENPNAYEEWKDAQLSTGKAPRFPTYKLQPFADKITRRNYRRMEFFTDSFGIGAVKVYFIHEDKETFINIYAPYYVLRFKLWHEFYEVEPVPF